MYFDEVKAAVKRAKTVTAVRYIKYRLKSTCSAWRGHCFNVLLKISRQTSWSEFWYERILTSFNPVVVVEVCCSPSRFSFLDTLVF